MKKIILKNDKKLDSAEKWANFVKQDNLIQLENKELWPDISKDSKKSNKSKDGKVLESTEEKIVNEESSKIVQKDNKIFKDSTSNKSNSQPHQEVKKNTELLNENTKGSEEFPKLAKDEKEWKSVKNTKMENVKKSSEVSKISQRRRIQVIDESIMLKYQQSRTPTLIDKLKKNKKFKRINHDSDNIMNFVHQKPLKTVPDPPKVKKVLQNTIERNKGKKREIAKKSYSRLKKEILRNREERKKNENLDLENQVKQLSLEDQKPDEIKIKHSRNFRNYCDHFITEEIRSTTKTILSDLFKFQERAYKKNPIKAKANQRYVVGFSEILKYLEAKKLKLVIISPDLEPNQPSIDDTVDKIKNLCTNINIPYVFSIKRRLVGFLLLKKVPVSCVGIFNYEGTENNVKHLFDLVNTERINYSEKAK